MLELLYRTDDRGFWGAGDTNGATASGRREAGTTRGRGKAGGGEEGVRQKKARPVPAHTCRKKDGTQDREKIIISLSV